MTSSVPVVVDAGYIGSQMAKALARAGHAVAVLGWIPRFDRLHDIVRMAWDWMRVQAGA